MPTAWQTFPVEFRGGLISNLTPLQQGTNAVGSATVLQNFENNKEGGYSKVLGYTKHSDTAVAGEDEILTVKLETVSNVIAARKINAAAVSAYSSDLVSGDIGKTAYYSSTGSSWTFETKTTSSNSLKIRHTEAKLGSTEYIVFVDGVNYPMTYNKNSNTWAELTTPTDIQAAKHVAFFMNRMFYAKDNLLSFTDPDTVGTFGNLGSGVDSFDADITGLKVFRDQLLVFTEKSIRVITGTSEADMLNKPITEDVGCIDGDTIQEFGGDVIYLGPDGLRLLSATDRIGDFSLQIPSDKIQRTFNDFKAGTTNFCSTVIREKAQYRIFSYRQTESDSTSAGLSATKFTAQGAEGINWGTLKGIQAHVADSAMFSVDERIVFANDDGYVYRMENGNSFDSANIEAIYESPFFPITDPQIRKTIYKLTYYIDPNGTLDISSNLKFDFEQSRTDVIQPATFSIQTNSTGVSIYGAAASIFCKRQKFTATASQTAFVIQDVEYTVGTDVAKVSVTINGVATTAFTVASVADGDNFDITVTLSSGASLDDEVVIILIPPSINSETTFGGEIDKVYISNVIGSGKTVAIRITDNSVNSSFTLDTAILEFSQQDRQ